MLQLDAALLARRGDDEIQLDPFLGYASNVASIPSFRNIFVASSYPCWRCGAILIHSFYPLVLKHSGAIIRAPGCVFRRPATLLSKPTIPKSPARFGISLIARSQLRLARVNETAHTGTDAFARRDEKG
jgi:hypothetical protein